MLSVYFINYIFTSHNNHNHNNHNHNNHNHIYLSNNYYNYSYYDECINNINNKIYLYNKQISLAEKQFENIINIINFFDKLKEIEHKTHISEDANKLISFLNLTCNSLENLSGKTFNLRLTVRDNLIIYKKDKKEFKLKLEETENKRKKIFLEIENIKIQLLSYVNIS
ncbi:hypothetical protein EHP00_2343 [Ecytonucleospora hepatopenaei]|uniref:Uncharacterized protein n=1 Tax=Ecytonucleospora hepatopenaei TaxID=646526 RepID=A0A1W0E8B4_9MICR|nr:hypothetical protein EHP00_2343 [Ecytonucleospora hepatopenaei]